MKRAIAVGAVLLVGAFGFVACDSDDGESQASAEESLCTSLDGFSAAVVKFQALDPQTASQDDYEAAAAAIQDAWGEVKAEAEDVAEADTAALDSAQAELSSAVENLPQDVPVSEAIAGLQPDVAAVAQAWGEIYDGVGCGAATTDTTETGTTGTTS
jgi:hypothetical protein